MLLEDGASKAPYPEKPESAASSHDKGDKGHEKGDEKGENLVHPLPRVGRYQLPEVEGALLSIETATGDITVHCSDSLHRAHRPTERIRKVVYTGFGLPPLAGDIVPKVSKREQRAARARLTNVRDRIDAAEGAQ